MLTVGDTTIGRVMRFAGNRSNERWVGYARGRSWSDCERRKGFSSKREAVAWVEDEARKLDYTYDD